MTSILFHSCSVRLCALNNNFFNACVKVFYEIIAFLKKFGSVSLDNLCLIQYSFSKETCENVGNIFFCLIYFNSFQPSAVFHVTLG